MNKKNKRIFVGFSIIVAAVFVAGMVLSGCGPAEAPAPAPAPAPVKKVVSGTPRVAYIATDVGPWYDDKWFSFKDEAEKLGWEVTLYNPGGHAFVSKQIAQVEDTVAAGYDGIVLHPVSGTALLPAVKKALAAGVYVITEHSPLAEPIVPHMWEGPAEAGRVLGMLLADLIGGEGKVFMLNGPPGQMESLAEEEAMVWIFDTFFPRIEYFREWPETDVAASLASAQDFLTRQPDVAGMYAWSGPFGGVGIIQALKAAGYKPGEVKVVASYSVPEDHELMMEGWYEYLMPGRPCEVARTSVRNMARMFRGEAVPMEINVPMITIGRAAEGKWDQTGWYWEE